MGAGNISNVAKGVKDKCPDKLYVIAADNDRLVKLMLEYKRQTK